jgi:hypothetical protein
VKNWKGLRTQGTRRSLRHGKCYFSTRSDPQFSELGGPIRTFIVSLLGAAAFTAGILVVRLHRVADYGVKGQIPAGERNARAVSLEELRALGF